MCCHTSQLKWGARAKKYDTIFRESTASRHFSQFSTTRFLYAQHCLRISNVMGWFLTLLKDVKYMQWKKQENLEGYEVLLSWEMFLPIEFNMSVKWFFYFYNLFSLIKTKTGNRKMTNWNFSHFFVVVCEIATWQRKSIGRASGNNDALRSKLVLFASGYQYNILENSLKKARALIG